MATKPHHIFFISLHLQFKALNKDPRYMIGWEVSLLAADQHCGMDDHFKGRRADISPAIKKISRFAFQAPGGALCLFRHA